MFLKTTVAAKAGEASMRRGAESSLAVVTPSNSLSGDSLCLLIQTLLWTLLRIVVLAGIMENVA